MTLSVNELSPPLTSSLVSNPPPKKLVGSAVGSLGRLADDKAHAARNLDSSQVNRRFNALTRPGSVAGSMKKAGIALIATPDPITGVIGVPLLAGSYVMKKKEPATLANLAEETSRVLREIRSLSL